MNDHRARAVAMACALMLGPALFARAADRPSEPLHARIDRLLERDRIGPTIATSSDAEFLRRISIDLTGMPPSPDELARFLADKDPEKRARIVDRLLDGPLFVRQWATTLDVMWMERLPEGQVPAGKWEAFLLDAARRDRPLHEIVAEILQTDGGGDVDRRTPARFYLDRGSEPNRITRDVGRLFFGRDLQCAQCHNHPLVEDYRQSDYQGLLAFFSPGSELVKMQGMKKTTFFPERAAKDLTFDSVFVKDDHHLTGPRLPGGTELDEPEFPPGDEYKVKPAGLVMPVPRHSRRAMLASLVSSGDLPAFNENLANRLWAMMMGRGIVHPLDMNHPGNPPVHPELLAMLGREIAAMGFHVRPFLRELARTRAYQSAGELPERSPAIPATLAADLAAARSRTTTLEAAADRADEDYRKAEKAWQRAEAALIPIAADHDKALAAHAAAAKKEDEARKALTSAEKKVAAGRETARVLADAAGRADEVVKKLPKEKALADAAGVFARRSAAAAAELVTFEKGVADQSSALKKAGEGRADAAGKVDSLRARLREVRATVRREEAAALEVRRRRYEARSAMENHRRRVAALDAYARWQEVRRRLDVHHREVEALSDTLGSASKRAEAQAAIVGTRREEARKAGTEHTAAVSDLARAESDLDRRRKAAAGVDSALSATRAALALLPDDPDLEETARKLEGKTGELRASLAVLASRVDRAKATRDGAAEAERSASEALRVSEAEARGRDQKARTARERLDATKARGDALRSELATAANELTDLLTGRFALGALKPLTPEQLYWSMVKVTGVYDRTHAEQEAQYDQVHRGMVAIGGAAVAAVEAEFATSAAADRDRSMGIERRTHDKLKSGLRSFVRIYGAGPGQPQGDFFATADQALFASNSGPINGWIAPSPGNVSQRMLGESDPRKAADDLYRTILSRPPTGPEADETARMLSVPAKEKPAVVQELVWGLLTSAEFRFNH